MSVDPIPLGILFSLSLSLVQQTSHPIHSHLPCPTFLTAVPSLASDSLHRSYHHPMHSCHSSSWTPALMAQVASVARMTLALMLPRANKYGVEQRTEEMSDQETSRGVQ